MPVDSILIHYSISRKQSGQPIPCAVNLRQINRSCELCFFFKRCCGAPLGGGGGGGGRGSSLTRGGTGNSSISVSSASLYLKEDDGTDTSASGYTIHRARLKTVIFDYDTFKCTRFYLSIYFFTDNKTFRKLHTNFLHFSKLLLYQSYRQIVQRDDFLNYLRRKYLNSVRMHSLCLRGLVLTKTAELALALVVKSTPRRGRGGGRTSLRRSRRRRKSVQEEKGQRLRANSSRLSASHKTHLYSGSQDVGTRSEHSHSKETIP